MFQFVLENWSGSHQAHVAFQDVPELGEFVQRCFSDEFAYAGFVSAIGQDLVSDDAWVEVEFEHSAIAHFVLGHEFGFAFFGVHVHASEFVYFEWFTVLADSYLGEEDRTWRTYVDGRAYENADGGG